MPIVGFVALAWSFPGRPVKIGGHAMRRPRPQSSTGTSDFEGDLPATCHRILRPVTESARNLESSPSRLPTVYRWSDAISPLVLLRCVQPAFSFTVMLVACAAYWLSAAVHAQLDSPDNAVAGGIAVSPGAAMGWPGQVSPADPAGQPAAVLAAASHRYWQQATRYSLSPAATLVGYRGGSSGWKLLVMQLATYAIWLVPVAIVLRASITSCAERRSTGLTACLRLIRQRFLALAAVTLIPVLAIILLAAGYWLVGLLMRLTVLGADLVMLATAPVLVAIGTLAIGSAFAVPLAWAAVLTERNCDVFDALSRGYEYTLRRLVALAVYLLAAFAIHYVTVAFVSAVCLAGWNIASGFVSTTSDGGAWTGVSETFVMRLPAVFSVVQLWALVGGIYLLLRRDANGQEVEDIEEDLAAAADTAPQGEPA